MAVKRTSGQGGILVLAGVGTFGVTRIRLKSKRTLADTTVTTSNGFEEFFPIVKGLTYEVEVPFDQNLSGVAVTFNNAMFAGNPGGLACSFSNTGIASSMTAGLLEDYELLDENKEVCRLVYTIRATGSFSET